MPALSIVVPFYDEEAFVDAAVGSVLAQPGPPAEVIVVNDNPAAFGPDFFAARPWAGRVRLLCHERNRGLSAARNSGIAAASGEWIGFLDADDFYTADGLAAQLAAAQGSGADIVHARALRLEPGGVPAPLGRDAALFARPIVRAGLTGLEEAQFFVSSWSSLYRRGFLDSAGLAFDPEQTRFEDRLFVLDSVLAARRIAVTGAAVRVWRRRAGSISTAVADAETHRLQLQLLEKCMAAVRRAAARQGLPARFVKREIFNTLSRLIWDVSLVAAAAAGEPGHAGMDGRIAALFADGRVGEEILSDPVIRKVSRVGMQTRRGRVTRGDFFALQGAFAAGDLGAAAERLARLLPAAAPVAPVAPVAPAAWSPRTDVRSRQPPRGCAFRPFRPH